VAEHSPFGGSQAGRYLKCPGSIQLAEKAPPPKTSVYAEEGTFAHALLERCLTADLRPGDLVGSTVRHPSVDSEKAVTEEMADAVDVCVKLVWEIYHENDDSEIEVEQRIGLTVPEVGRIPSTLDVSIYSPSAKKLTLIDYKHGQGVMVASEDSPQGMFYVLADLEAHPEWVVEEVEIIIVQPRSAVGEKIKRWTMPLWQIIEFRGLLEEAIGLALAPNPPFEAGDHCTFCPAKTICTVREQAFLKEAGPAFKSIAEIDLSDVPDANDTSHMARIVAAYENLAPWIASLREHIDAILMAGGEVEGWKVVEKQARRSWSSGDDEVAGYLQLNYDIDPELITPRKLVNLTEAKRVLKGALDKGQYAEAERDMETRFTRKESAGLTTAPVSDKRPAVAVTASSAFGEVMLGAEE